jgi:hypothetical protein
MVTTKTEAKNNDGKNSQNKSCGYGRIFAVDNICGIQYPIEKTTDITADQNPILLMFSFFI